LIKTLKRLANNKMSERVLQCVIYGNNITIFTKENLKTGSGAVPKGCCFSFNVGPLGTVPELLFEKKRLIYPVQQLLIKADTTF
jgi:hypothetical protein